MNKIETNIYRNLRNILFIDIETVPAYPAYNELPDTFKKFWIAKASRLKSEDDQTPEDLYPRAGILRRIRENNLYFCRIYCG